MTLDDISSMLGPNFHIWCLWIWFMSWGLMWAVLEEIAKPKSAMHILFEKPERKMIYLMLFFSVIPILNTYFLYLTVRQILRRMADDL